MYNSSTCPINWLVQAVHTQPNTTAIEDVYDLLQDNIHTSVALAVGLLIISLFVTFLGSYLVKPTIFLTSFLSAGAVTLAAAPAIVSNTSMSETASCLTVGLVPLGVGVTAGLISVFSNIFGMAILGFGAGAGAGYALYLGALYNVPIMTVGPTTLMHILCIMIGGLLGAGLLLKFQHNLFMVATSALGACGTVAATALLLAHVDPRFLSSLRMSIRINGSYDFVWPQALAVFVLFLLGIFVQCRMAARKRERMRDQEDGLAMARVQLVYNDPYRP